MQNNETKKEKFKTFIITSVVISIIIFFLFLSFKSQNARLNDIRFNSELYYLNQRAMAALFNKESIESIDDLKKYIAEDDEKIEDFRKRGLIAKFLTTYSDLKSFRESKKTISEYNEDYWIDYSTQKIENGIYTVKVSEESCDMLNEGTTKKSRKCTDNIFKIDLNNNKDTTK